jgi:hypothetical protein
MKKSQSNFFEKISQVCTHFAGPLRILAKKEKDLSVSHSIEEAILLHNQKYNKNEQKKT